MRPVLNSFAARRCLSPSAAIGIDVDLGFQELGRDLRHPPTCFPKAPNLQAFHSVFVQEKGIGLLNTFPAVILVKT